MTTSVVHSLGLLNKGEGFRVKVRTTSTLAPNVLKEFGDPSPRIRVLSIRGLPGLLRLYYDKESLLFTIYPY